MLQINTQKSVAFLYTNNKRSEREIQETIPFTITSKRRKYLGINLSKETKETRVQSRGREDPLEEDMATHSSILAWRIPWTEELGAESDTTEQLTLSLFHFH